MNEQRIESTEIVRFTTAMGAFLGLVEGDLLRSQKPGVVTSQSVLALVAAAGMTRVWVRVRHGKMPVLEEFVATMIRYWAEDRGYRSPQRGMTPVRDWLSSREMVARPPIIGNALETALKDERFVEQPVNRSWGSGCLPISVAVGVAPTEGAFFTPIVEAGAAVASRTHGHEIAQLASGALASILRSLGDSSDIPSAVEEAKQGIAEAKTDSPIQFDSANKNVVLSALQRSIDRSQGGGTYEAASDFGWKGHRADEALALAIWAARGAGSAAEAARLASSGVPEKHATAAIAAALWGARKGSEIGRGWAYVGGDTAPGTDLVTAVLGTNHRLTEHMIVTVETVIGDMVRIFGEPRITDIDSFRWPGY